MKYYRSDNDDGTRYKELMADSEFALLKACLSYNITTGIYFSTYLGACVDNQIRMTHRDTSRHNNLISLDTPVQEDKSRTYKDYLGSDDPQDNLYSVEDLEVIKESYEIMFSGWFSPREKTLMKMYIDGMTQTEIGKTLEMSQSYCARIIGKMYTKTSQILNFSNSNNVPLQDIINNPKGYYKHIFGNIYKGYIPDRVETEYLELINSINNEIKVMKGEI